MSSKMIPEAEGCGNNRYASVIYVSITDKSHKTILIDDDNNNKTKMDKIKSTFARCKDEKRVSTVL